MFVYSSSSGLSIDLSLLKLVTGKFTPAGLSLVSSTDSVCPSFHQMMPPRPQELGRCKGKFLFSLLTTPLTPALWVGPHLKLLLSSVDTNWMPHSPMLPLSGVAGLSLTRWPSTETPCKSRLSPVLLANWPCTGCRNPPFSASRVCCNGSQTSGKHLLTLTCLL